jgi:hypothetical protein
MGQTWGGSLADRATKTKHVEEGAASLWARLSGVGGYMKEEVFVDVYTPGWWLLQPQLEAPLADERKKLGERWGWTEPEWYAISGNLLKIFQYLNDEGLNLHKQLDDMLLKEQEQGIDASKRSEWLQLMIEAKKQTESSPASVAEGSADAAAATVADAAPPLPPPPPPTKPSAFGRKESAPSSEAAATRDAVAELSALSDRGAISKEDLDELVKDPDLGAKLAAAEAELQDELRAEIQAELEAELAAAEVEE